MLKHEASGGYREINRRARMEISMSDLPEEAMEQLAVYDDYPWDYTPFQVGDETVLVGDDRLAEAPRAIPEKERNIILLYWFPGLADREIADRCRKANGEHAPTECLSAAEKADGRM